MADAPAGEAHRRPSLRPRLTTPRRGGAPDAGVVVDAARRALPALAALTPLERGRALLAVAADLEERRAQFVDEVRRAGGGRFSDAVAAVDGALDDAVRWAGWADKLDLLAPARDPRSSARVVALPAAPGFRAVAAALLAVAADGGACVVVGAGRPEELLVEAVAAQLPPGAVGVLPPPVEALDLTGLVDVVDLRGSGDDGDDGTSGGTPGEGCTVLRGPAPTSDARRLAV